MDAAEDPVLAGPNEAMNHGGAKVQSPPPGQVPTGCRPDGRRAPDPSGGSTPPPPGSVVGTKAVPGTGLTASL